MAPEIKRSLSSRISALLRFLDEILDAFWAFVISVFSKSLAPLHKLENFIRPKNNTEKKRDTSYIQTLTVSNVVPTPPANNQSEQCRYRNDPWWKTAAEMLGIAAVVAYTVFSGFQMHYAHQQATAANATLQKIQEQFQFDQRPFLKPMTLQMMDLETGKPTPPQIGKPLAVNISVKNLGKSVALNAFAHRHMLFGKFIAPQFKIEPPDPYDRSVDAVAQSQEITVTAVVSAKDTYAIESVDVDPSNLLNWDGVGPIMVFGRITYDDTFGGHYCTPFAYEYITSGNWAKASDFTIKTMRYKVTDLCPNMKPF